MTTTRTIAFVPTITITGSGGMGSGANKITFNFNKAIQDGSFTVDDIGIINGTINSGSFTKVSATQYTIITLCLHYLHETHPNGLNQHQSLCRQYQPDFLNS
jgi:hypothetical protein